MPKFGKNSLENIEDTILGFQFEPVFTKTTPPSCNQDETENQYNRLSSQE